MRRPLSKLFKQIRKPTIKMTLIQILQKIFRKKKKAGPKVPEVVVVTPGIDPLTGEVIQVVAPFTKQIDLIKSKLSYLKYLDLGKNSLNVPNYMSSEAGIKDFFSVVSPAYALLKNVKIDDVLKVIVPIYGLTSFLNEKFGPGDNGKDVPGGIYFNYKFFKGGDYFGADAPFKEKCSVGYFKGTWKPAIESESGFSYETVQKYFLLFYPLIRSGYFPTQKEFYAEIKKIENLIKLGRTNYQESLNNAIYEIKIDSKKAKDLFNLETNYYKQFELRNQFNAIKNIINATYNNPLSDVVYTWIVTAAKPIDNSPVDVAPNTGTGTQTGGGINTGTETGPGTQTGTGTTTTPSIPFNDGRYPDWTNKDYTPNNTVYYLGKLYKSVTSIYGNNNNTPNLDGRWIIL